MAQIGKERWGQYKRNVLSILRDNPEGLHRKVLFAELDNIMPPNEFENDSYESSGQRGEVLLKVMSYACEMEING